MTRESERMAQLRRELGERLRLVRSTAGLTQGDLATATYCDRTTVAHIEKGRARADEQFWATADTMCLADGRLVTAFADLQAAKADEELSRHQAAVDEARVRLTHLDESRDPLPTAHRPEHDHIGSALEWLDLAAGWTPGTARRDVERRFAALDVGQSRDHAAHRGHVKRTDIARSLRAYYERTPAPGYGCYTATVDGVSAETSILTRSTWLDLDCPMTSETDQLRFSANARVPTVALDDVGATRAVERLAEMLALNTRLVDLPLYALVDLDVHHGRLAGTFGIAPFAQFGLTLDLLEGELLDAVATGAAVFSLRDKYLPDRRSLVDFSRRLCVGGVAAVCAIARPAGPYDHADYLLLLQQRSRHVVNAAQRLALIPKGFHQPMTDYRADVRARVTLLRELEEELFGRNDLDNTEGDQRCADPMHPSRLSEPMRWLLGESGRLRMECTGVGVNTVNGNFELAGLVVIDDEEFWNRYGGLVEANWESSTLRRYSTRDPESLGELVTDDTWTVEGPFALAQGLRRLSALDPARVDLPRIGWQLD